MALQSVNSSGVTSPGRQRLGATPSAPDEARGRRCGARRFEPGGPRPSDLLNAFFAAGLAMLVAAGMATMQRRSLQRALGGALVRAEPEPTSTKEDIFHGPRC